MARRRGRGFRRQVQRKFVWDRTFGFLPTTSTGPFGVDLLAGFRGQPGATHLGATVTASVGLSTPSSPRPLKGPSSSAGLASGSTAGTRTRRSSPTSPKSSRTKTGWAGCPTSLTGLRLPTLRTWLPGTRRPTPGLSTSSLSGSSKSSTRRCGCS